MPTQRAGHDGPRAKHRLAATLPSPLGLAGRVLPATGTPVLLGAGALAAAGIIDWPLVGAAGLGYAALRRWRPPARRADRRVASVPS